MEDLITAIIFEVVYMQDNGCKYAGHYARQQITDPKWGSVAFMSEVNRKIYEG